LYTNTHDIQVKRAAKSQSGAQTRRPRRERPGEGREEHRGRDERDGRRAGGHGQWERGERSREPGDHAGKTGGQEKHEPLVEQGRAGGLRERGEAGGGVIGPPPGDEPGEADAKGPDGHVGDQDAAQRVVQVAEVLLPEGERGRLLDTPAPRDDVVVGSHPPARDLPPQSPPGLSVHRDENVAFPHAGALGGQIGQDRPDDAVLFHPTEADGFRAEGEDAAEQQEVAGAEHQDEVHPPVWPPQPLSHAVRSRGRYAPLAKPAQDPPASSHAGEARNRLDRNSLLVRSGHIDRFDDFESGRVPDKNSPQE
jgi:hypothetical protein